MAQPAWAAAAANDCWRSERRGRSRLQRAVDVEAEVVVVVVAFLVALLQRRRPPGVPGSPPGAVVVAGATPADLVLQQAVLWRRTQRRSNGTRRRSRSRVASREFRFPPNGVQTFTRRNNDERPHGDRQKRCRHSSSRRCS